MSSFFAIRAHQIGNQIGHIHRLGLNGYRIARKGILLHPVYVGVNTVRNRHNQRNSDDTNASCKGGHECPRLFCHQVIERKGKGGHK